MPTPKTTSQAPETLKAKTLKAKAKMVANAPKAAKPTSPAPPPKPKAKPKAAAPIKAADAGAAAKPTGKLGIVFDMLCSKEGATIAELQKATGWEAKSVHGALSGGLRKRGYKVSFTKTTDGNVYSIGEA